LALEEKRNSSRVLVLAYTAGWKGVSGGPLAPPLETEIGLDDGETVREGIPE
jgi:hypothetical protein